MKRKVTSLILGLAVCLCMCGCDSDDFPDVLLYPTATSAAFMVKGIDIRTVDNDIMDKCFEKIKIGPATLTLPMNVSDLPGDIVFCADLDGTYSDPVLNTYNGMKTITAELCIGESSQTIAYADVLCTDAENYLGGVIISLSVFPLTTNVYWGDFSMDMPFSDISEAMGCGGEALGNECVFASRDGRAVYLKIYDDGENIAYISISAVPETISKNLVS